MAEAKLSHSLTWEEQNLLKRRLVVGEGRRRFIRAKVKGKMVEVWRQKY